MTFLRKLLVVYTGTKICGLQSKNKKTSPDCTGTGICLWLQSSAIGLHTVFFARMKQRFKIITFKGTIKKKYRYVKHGGGQ
jgi:hypothetical protein